MRRKGGGVSAIDSQDRLIVPIPAAVSGHCTTPSALYPWLGCLGRWRADAGHHSVGLGRYKTFGSGLLWADYMPNYLLVRSNGVLSGQPAAVDILLPCRRTCAVKVEEPQLLTHVGRDGIITLHSKKCDSNSRLLAKPLFFFFRSNAVVMIGLLHCCPHNPLACICRFLRMHHV
ncbi:hypothetical protein IF2G_03896 [Cordyceps javanica]|nr:hypothetical protein IF2G_03896 [Cordyceps javanica]